ncbi:MAG: hypothetical protein IKZ89_10550, partial [Bacteroidaceae bacterium]|nr:hypothetical protein [Bacteroidaceae bacterium]
MNKIYRTVYNETTGTWVAVCETAKTHTKSSGKSSVVKAVAAVGMAAVAGVAMAGSVTATNDTVSDATNLVSATGSDNSTAKRLKVEAVEGALGKTLTKNADGSYSDATYVVIDENGNLTTYGQGIVSHKVQTGVKSQIAVGDNAQSNAGGAVAVGSHAYAGGAQSVAVGMGASSNGGGAVAIGGGLSQGTLQGAIANGYGAVSIGVNSTALSEGAVSMGRDATAKESAVAIGSYANGYGEGSVAIGGANPTYHTETYGKGTVAIGRNATAKASILKRDDADGKIDESRLTSTTGNKILETGKASERHLAFDKGDAELTGKLALGQNIAIGDESQAYSHQSIAVGANTMALGVGAIAIGGDDLGRASDINKTAGDDGYDAGFTASMKTLQDVKTSLAKIRKDYKDKAELVGALDEPKVITNTLSAAAEQDKAYVDTTMAVGDGSMAIGFKSAAKGSLSDAIGMGAMATGDSSLAVGTVAEAQGKFSNAVGTAALAEGNNANAFGLAAIAEGNYSNAIGTSAASGNYSSAMGYMNRALGDNAVAVGTLNVSGGDRTSDTVAMGVNNKATGEKSIAIGASFTDGTGTERINEASGQQSIAVGSGNIASQQESVAIGKGNTAGGYQSLAYGSENNTTGHQSIAFGTSNEVSSQNSGAFGTGNVVNNGTASNGSYTVGNSNQVASENTFVLGSRVTDTLANSVYLGADSTTTAAGGAGINDDVTDGTVNGITYGTFKGSKAVGIVSVGSAGQERRIKNVAAGRIGVNSTDAINGSQLYAVLPKYTDTDNNGYPESVTVGNKTYKFANYKAGNNITIANDGTISATVTGGYYSIGTDNRLVSLDSNTIVSPYLHIQGVTANPDDKAYANGQDSIAMGKWAKANQDNSLTIGENSATAWSPTNNTKGYASQGVGSIAIGDTARTYTSNGKSDTDNRYANADKSIAIGYNAHTHAAAAVALGSGADATGERSISIGGTEADDDAQNETRHQGSRSAGQGSIAIGDQARAVTNDKMTNDKDDTLVMQRDTNANDAVAIGTKALAQNQSAIALGGGVSYTATQNDQSNKTTYSKEGAKAGGVASVAIGGASQNTNGAEATGEYAIALGTGSNVSSSKSAAVGSNNTVSTNDTFVLGSGVSETVENSVFLGKGASKNVVGAGATGTVNNANVNGITYGGFAGATSKGLVSVGSSAADVRRVSGVAAGEISATSTDAINGSQLFAVLPKYMKNDGNGNLVEAGNNDTPDVVKIGDVTYNIGGGSDGNTVTSVTVNDGQTAADQASGDKDGNLKLTETTDAAGNPTY